MPTETTLDAVLNGIITCGQCNAGMALNQDETGNRTPPTSPAVTRQARSFPKMPDPRSRR